MVLMGDEVTVLLDIGLFCRFAAAHTSEAVMDRWEVVKVSTQVAFQTNKLPFDQGAMVIPSGCFTICSIETWAQEHWQRTKPCVECH